MTLLAKTLENPLVDVTVAGITIVFGMLILLVLVISVFGAIMSGTSKKEKKEKPLQTVVPKKQPIVSQPVIENDDDEVIAVITAAVYSMYEGTGVKPVIKAIRPSVGKTPWSMAGIRQNMRSFF